MTGHRHILRGFFLRHGHFGKKSSASAAGWLTIRQYTDAASCFKAVRDNYKRIYATHLGSEAYSLYNLNLTEPVALVFGNEHEGVSAEVLGLCDGNFVIPQVGMVQSLNISVACAVSLYEAFRQRDHQGLYDKARLPEQQRIALESAWGLKSKE